MLKCLVCDNEATYNLEWLHHMFDDNNNGFCVEHNFIHTESVTNHKNVHECKNENHIHNDLDGILLMSLLFSYSQLNRKLFFNVECSDEIRKIVIELSYINTDLYFLAIRKLNQMIQIIYGNIKCASDYSNVYKVSDVEDDFCWFLMSQIILVCKTEKNQVQYKFASIYEKSTIIDRNSYLEYCDYCDVWFIDQNAISIVYDENKNPISKECGNCRKLDLNISYIIKFLNKERKSVLEKYLKLIRNSNLNTDVILVIMSCLFGENNVKALTT